MVTWLTRSARIATRYKEPQAENALRAHKEVWMAFLSRFSELTRDQKRSLD